MNITRKELGERIKSIRLNLGLTGEEFGNIVGGTRSMVSSWEHGRTSPTASRLAKIATLAKVSVNELTNKDVVLYTDTLTAQPLDSKEIQFNQAECEKIENEIKNSQKKVGEIFNATQEVLFQKYGNDFLQLPTEQLILLNHIIAEILKKRLI